MSFRTAIALALGGMLALPGAAIAQTTVKLWALPFDETVQKAFQDVIAKFEEKNPGITVKAETRGVDEHKTAMRVAIGSDQAPDIYFMWSGLGLGGEFVNAGASAPLDKEYADHGWDQRFLPAALGDSRRYKGERHGVPYVMNGEAVYYNKELFQKAGIAAPPTTYDELLAAAEKLKAARIPAFTFGGSVNWHLMRLMDVILETKCGAAKHDALMLMQADWSQEPCATDSFTEFKKWTDTYTLKPFMGISDAQSQSLFYAGRAAMMLEGDWLVKMLEINSDLSKYGLFTFPTGTDRLYFFSSYFYVSASSKNKDAAIKFLDFLTSREVQQAHLGDFGATSVTAGLDYSADKRTLDHQWNEIFTKYTQTFVNGDQAFPLDVTTEYWRVINQVASGDMEPAAAAAQMQSFIGKRG